MSEIEQDQPLVLSVRNLTTRLQTVAGPVTVVDNISFDLHGGRTLALVGESGSGKSMTALSMLGILPKPPALPPAGEVFYRGCDLLKLSESKLRRLRGAKLAMIFQDPMSALNPVYPIGTQLMEVVDLHLGLDPEEGQAKVLDALREVGIPSPEQRWNEFPHQLSGGMKQRVMIAMAMLCEPDVLIADEPTTALDVTVQAQVLELMRTMLQERGTALMLITHDMGVVAEMADEVMVMYAAQIVERGPVAKLFDNPAHPYTRGLFASRPVVGRTLVPIPGSVPFAGAFPIGCRFHPRCGDKLVTCEQAPPEIALSDGHCASCWLHCEAADD